MNIAKAAKKLPPHAIVAASAWVSKIASAGSQLISIRVLIDVLGVDLYAAFSILVGVSGWFMLIDMGIGPSLQNFVAEYRAAGKDPSGIMIAASICALGGLASALTVSWFLAPILASFLLAGTFLSSWDSIACIRIASAAFLGAGTGGLAYRLWFGEDRGYLSNIVPAAASVCGLLAVWLASHFDRHPSLPLCLALWAAPSALGPLVIVVIRLKRNLDAFGFPSRVHFHAIWTRSGRFFALALMASITLQVDYIVLARVATSDQIAQYNLLSRAFALMFFVYGSVLSSLWPTFTKLAAQRDGTAIRFYLFRCIAFGMVTTTLGTSGLILFGSTVSKILSGGSIPIVSGAACMIGIYYLARVWTDAFSTVIMSVSRISAMLWLAPLQAVISLSAQIFLGSRYGLYGISGALALSFLTTAAWVLPLQVKRLGLLN